MPGVEVKIDLARLGAFAKTLDKQAATQFRRELRKTVTEVGGEALRRAKSNASFSTGHTSRKPKTEGAVGDVHGAIPDAISLRTSFAGRSAGVKMRTDRKKAPQAYFFERGSKGSGGSYIRHPVFGNRRVYRSMPTRKFFYQAVWDHKDDLKNRLNEELAATARDLGFNG